MRLSKEVLEGINKEFGGTVRYDAAVSLPQANRAGNGAPAARLEHALDAGEGKGLYRRIALLWRAILVGHPFTDGNKRTALAVACVLLQEAGTLTDGTVQERLMDELLLIAEESLEDIPRIERRVKYAAEER